MGVIFNFFSVRKAARMDPIEAFRYEYPAAQSGRSLEALAEWPDPVRDRAGCRASDFVDVFEVDGIDAGKAKYSRRPA